MILYNKKHFTIFTLVKALFVTGAKEKLIKFFREYTGKKYILLTGSCRSALYLTYKALDVPGEIITTPLTCRSAIDPIILAGYRPVFQDVDSNTLTLSDIGLEKKINSRTRGIQLVHFGGFVCSSKSIIEIARKNHLFIIEDCAQGLFSEADGLRAGSLGDYVCISLLKNANGIGGGILATDDESLFRKAELIQKSFRKTGSGLLLFRIIQSSRTNVDFLFNKLYIWLLSLRKYNQINHGISDYKQNQ